MLMDSGSAYWVVWIIGIIIIESSNTTHERLFYDTRVYERGGTRVFA